MSLSSSALRADSAAKPSGKPWDAINFVLYFPPNKLYPSPAHSPPTTPAAFLPFGQTSLQPQSLCSYCCFFFFLLGILFLPRPSWLGSSHSLGLRSSVTCPPFLSGNTPIPSLTITSLDFISFITFMTLRFFIVSDLIFLLSAVRMKAWCDQGPAWFISNWVSNSVTYHPCG